MGDSMSEITNPTPPKKPKKKRTAKSYAISFFIKAAITAIALWVLLYWIAGRVIAAEGDSVDILSDYVTVNGYGIFEDTLYPTTSEGASITFPYTVSENCVFVLNDYRSDISDSRTFGAIRLDDVQGKVVFVMRRRGI